MSIKAHPGVAPFATLLFATLLLLGDLAVEVGPEPRGRVGPRGELRFRRVRIVAAEAQYRHRRAGHRVATRAAEAAPGRQLEVVCVAGGAARVHLQHAMDDYLTALPWPCSGLQL